MTVCLGRTAVKSNESDDRTPTGDLEANDVSDTHTVLLPDVEPTVKEPESTEGFEISVIEIAPVSAELETM